MGGEHFRDAIFELSDLWVPNLGKGEYVTFLRVLLEKMRKAGLGVDERSRSAPTFRPRNSGGVHPHLKVPLQTRLPTRRNSDLDVALTKRPPALPALAPARNDAARPRVVLGSECEAATHKSHDACVRTTTSTSDTGGSCDWVELLPAWVLERAAASRLRRERAVVSRHGRPATAGVCPRGMRPSQILADLTVADQQLGQPASGIRRLWLRSKPESPTPASGARSG